MHADPTGHRTTQYQMPMKQKPKLGQNFLVDDNARHAIVASLGDISERTIIEIGPGHGAITDLLAPRAKRLKLYDFIPTLPCDSRPSKCQDSPSPKETITSHLNRR